MPKKLPFLRVSGKDIVDETGRPIILRGVALGGWLLMEGYMYCGRNIPEREFRASFERALGRDGLDDFTRSFRDSFIRESDIKLIKEWGANCVRIPFNYRILEYEDRPFSLNEEGLGYLDRIVRWCEKHGIYCILDMHAAPGGQNEDWHADCSRGNPAFFSDETNRDRYFRLWHFIADHFKSCSAIAGFDVLNEPVVPIEREGIVKDLYERVTKEIRDVDSRHIIFLEGNVWAQRLQFLGKPADKNTAYSIHVYPPVEFTFNWETDLVYPGKVNNVLWDRESLEVLAKSYTAFMQEIERPLYVGEFGVNWRGGYFGELAWVKDILGIFRKHKVHWTYWTYKTVANYTFPDGVFRFTGNPPWVNRKGPVPGWESFPTFWPKERARMIDSWKTDKFSKNEKLYAMLQRYFLDTE